MERAQAEEIVTEFFDTWYSAVVRYAYNRCGSMELAEDFAQEAFGALYTALRKEAPIENPRAWILKTVRNQVCKHWRYRQRHPEELVPAAELDLFSNPEQRSDLGENSSGPSIAHFLDLLTPREQEAVLLRADGMKYHEIADHLGITSSSVGTLILRAIRKMRAARFDMAPMHAGGGSAFA
jgi:RNA polymerase sigma factor (sigma-70 family)